MSTPQPGGDREPLVITRPAAGGKPAEEEASGAGSGGSGTGSAKAGAARSGTGAAKGAAKSRAGAAKPGAGAAKPGAGAAGPAGAGATGAAKSGAGAATSGAAKSGAGAAGAARSGAARGGKGATTTGKGATTTGSGAAATGRGSAATGRSGRPSGRPGGGKGGPATAGKGGGRRPVTPVKVNQGTNWGPIALWTAVAVIVLAIIGYGGWQVYQNGLSWEDRAGQISGIKNYRKTEPAIMKPAQHAYGVLKYPQSPPVGGTHNPNWQDCMGDVYDAAIANEHAVHSMEHGAVWVTYRPDLPKAQIEQLAKKVRGNPYMLMSPYPGLDKPISLQTWGYQLKVDNAGDRRIDAFVKALRQNASVEPGAVCSGGITLTGTTPHDLQPQQQQQQGGTGSGG